MRQGAITKGLWEQLVTTISEYNISVTRYMAHGLRASVIQ